MLNVSTNQIKIKLKKAPCLNISDTILSEKGEKIELQDGKDLISLLLKFSLANALCLAGDSSKSPIASSQFLPLKRLRAEDCSVCFFASASQL